VILVGESFGPINLGGSDLAAEADLVILKLDGDGNHIFSAAYGSDSGIDAEDVAIDPSSQDIVLTGRFYGTLKFGALSSMTAANPGGNWDIFLVRFSPAGTPERSKRYGDTAEQSPESVSVAGSSVYLSAYFTGDFDFGGPNVTPLSTASFYSLALTKLSTGFLSHEWSRQIGESVFGSRLATDTAGNLYVAGGFAGALDIDTPALDSADGDTFLARLDSDGNTEWTKQLANVVIEELAVGPDQTLYVVGRADDEVDLGDGPVAGSGTLNVFIAHYAADGSHLWSRVFTAPVGNQFPSAIGVGSDGTTWVAADIEGQVDFGTGTLTTEGDRDVVVVGYAP
jgi:hypothetical protein